VRHPGPSPAVDPARAPVPDDRRNKILDPPDRHTSGTCPQTTTGSNSCTRQPDSNLPPEADSLGLGELQSCPARSFNSILALPRTLPGPDRGCKIDVSRTRSSGCRVRLGRTRSREEPDGDRTR
jgi:hypothetical protein